MLGHSIGSTTTKGTCLYAAFLCAQVIRKFSGFPTRIRGGDGELKKGINIQGGMPRLLQNRGLCEWMPVHR